MSITGIYPLEVGTNVSSFLSNESMRIYFSLGSNTTDKQIRFVHVNVKNQTTGKSVFKILYKQYAEASEDSTTTLNQYAYPDLLTFAFLDSDAKDTAQQIKSENGIYYIDIPESAINGSWDINTSYLIQIRGDITTDKNPIDYCYYDGAQWLMANSVSYLDYFNNTNNFIEWSNTIQKFPIGKPIINLDIPDKIYPWDTTFNGKIIFTDDNREKLITYQAWIEDSAQNVITSTDKVFTSNQYDANEMNFNLNLIPLITQDISKKTYTLNIQYETQHGYQNIESIDLNVQNCEKLPDEYDEGYFLTIEEDFDDFGIININWKRDSSSKDAAVSLLRMDTFNEAEIINEYDSSITSIVEVDFTCEPLRKYTYWLFVKVNDTYYYTNCKESISVQAYSPTLFDGENIIKLSYDFQVSNDTPNSRLTKVDTIGGKYPYFSTNAATDYHSFPIQGKIAVEDNYTEDGELSDYLLFMNLPTDLLTEYKEIDGRNSNYSNYNFLLQREYRKALLTWLNNGKPKLLRYLPIGSYIVMLTDISMTPETNLSSLIWDFSATAYEIGDGTDLIQIKKYLSM